MNCTNCGGKIDLDKLIILSKEEFVLRSFPCLNCGLLHYLQGNKKTKNDVHKMPFAVKNSRTGKMAYLINDEAVYK